MSFPKDTQDTTTEKALMEAAQVENLEVTKPRDVQAESHKPKIIPVSTLEQREEKREEEQIVRKAQPKKETAAQDMFLAFLRSGLRNTTEPQPSWFFPNPRMMFYIIHCSDVIMSQSYYFTRSTNFWHPYITRIYFGILYVIQVLRCMNFVTKATAFDRLFLTQFLEAFPPESLSIPGQLIPFFKSLCVSQPPNAFLGKVFPKLPEVGTRRSKNRIFNSDSAFCVPNIPLLIGFANRLTSPEARAALTARTRWPSPWNPLTVLSQSGTPLVDVQPVINGVEWTSDPTAWTDPDAWSLNSPGIEFETEAKSETDETFCRYGYRLRLPSLPADYDSRQLSSFLGLTDYTWFGSILPIMTYYSKFFRASGTLADCAVSGPACGQIICEYENPKTAPVKPTMPGDVQSNFPLTFTAHSTSANLSQTDQLYSFSSQVNARVFEEHPFFPTLGSIQAGMKGGPFWDIRPVEQHGDKETGYLQIEDIIRDHFALERAAN